MVLPGDWHASITGFRVWHMVLALQGNLPASCGGWRQIDILMHVQSTSKARVKVLQNLALWLPCLDHWAAGLLLPHQGT